MTEQELEIYLEKLGEGCEWYGNHPECFELYDNGFRVKIIDENIPEEAKMYVDFINKQTEANEKKDEMLKAMGIGGEVVHNPNPPAEFHFEPWED